MGPHPWACGHAMAPRVGPGHGSGLLGADGQAWELSWALSAAEAAGDAIAGVAVDFRKAYDTVRLALMARVLRAAGWPECIVGPVMSAYYGPRRLRVAGALGPAWDPLCGIPAGCPLAVDALAVLTWAWAVAVEAIPGPPAARRYVDDLTGWTRGSDPEQVVAAAADLWGVTRRFADACQLDVNMTKSVMFGAPASVRQALAAAEPEVVVATCFRDLGIQ